MELNKSTLDSTSENSQSDLEKLKIQKAQLEGLVGQLFNANEIIQQREQMETLLQRIEGLDGDLKLKEAALSGKQRELDKVISEMGSDCWRFENTAIELKRQEENLKAAIEVLKEQLTSSQWQSNELSKKISYLESDFHEKETELLQLLRAAETKEAAAVLQITNLTPKFQYLEQEVQHWKELYGRQSSKITALSEDYNAEKSQVLKLETELQKQKGQSLEDNAELEALRTAHREISEKLTASQRQLFKIQSEAHRKNLEINALKEGLQEIEQFHSDTTERMRASLVSEETEKKSLQAQLEKLKEKNQELKTICEENDKQIKSLQRDVGNRGQQLKDYSTTLTRERQEVIGLAKRLQSEIQSAATLHPLKDYLNFTEQEISKLEVQLSSTPTVSIDRRRLEICLSQMREQKRTLSAMIESSTTDLNRRSAWLHKVISKDAYLGSQAPPPPPIASYKVGDDICDEPA